MIDNKKYNGQLSLRIDPDLHQRIANAAAAENRSVNQFIAIAVDNFLNDDSHKYNYSANDFEKRHFIGKAIEGQQISTDSGLVLVDGIYYRYLISDNQPVNSQAKYVIMEATGNILTLKEVR